ncbi:MAG: ATP-binding cassette domain-containing protein [Coriobacteriales bacterium]
MGKERRTRPRLRSTLKTVAWALRLAWSIDSRLLAGTLAAVVLLSVLPAVALVFNREAIEQLSAFIATGQGSFEQLLPVLAAYGALLALIAVSSRINAEFLGTLLQNTYTYGMQGHLMDVVNGSDLLTLMRRNVNEDFNYIMRRSMALNQLVSCICAMVASAFSIGSLCVAAYSLAPAVLAITLVYVVLVVAVFGRFSKGTRFSWPRFRKAEVKAQFLRGMPAEPNVAKELRVFGCAGQLVQGWRSAYDVRLGLALERARSAELRGFASGAIFYLFLAACVGAMLWQMAQGLTTPAVVLTALTLCTKLFTAVSPLLRDLVAFDEALFSIEQQNALLAAGGAAPAPQPQAAEAARPSATAPVFSARGVGFSYTGSRQELRGVDLDIYPGEVVALVGENGSGKSTLVKLLMGVLPPQEGELRFKGVPYSQLQPGQLSKGIGAFFQDFYLYHHTLGENIAYGNVEQMGDEQAVLQALERGGAAHLLQRLPRGLQTMVRKRIDRNGVEFSGGEKQLLACARAYMGDKEVMVFDEPASMLDPLAELDQFARIRQRIGGNTGILISHRVGFARLADRIVVMEGGHVAEQGTHSELLAAGGLYARFFSEQAMWYEGGEEAL